MKAAIGLHKKPLSERLLPIGDVRVLTTLPAHKAAARAVADKSVTLIKDSGNLLPLNLKQHRRITWIGRPAPGFLPAMPDMPVSALRDGLRERGFVVSEFDPDAPPTPDNTDCVLYVLPSESSLGKSRIYLDWLREQPGMASIMARYWHDIPTAMVSFGHPYYLYDAPRIPCMINAYSSTPDSQLAVLARLLGQEKFEGVSPVDAFAGAPEARY
jgi:beta-N-acetylhexosaminidase